MYIIFTNYSTIYDINLLYIYTVYIYTLVPANSSMAFFNRSNGPSDFSFASLNCPNKES